MQLNSINKDSYLAMNGSKLALILVSIYTLILISGSVIAVMKNLCRSLFTCMSYLGVSLCLSLNYRNEKVWTASFLIWVFSWLRNGRTDSDMNFKTSKFFSISPRPKLHRALKARMIISIYSCLIFAISSGLNFLRTFLSISSTKFLRKN